MGSDPNSYPVTPQEKSIHPRLALTLGDMIGRKWAIRAKCDRCGALMWCDPRQMTASVGAETFFWGRRGKCRMMSDLRRCIGLVSFQAKPLKSDIWHSLDEPLMTARHLWKVRKAKAPAG